VKRTCLILLFAVARTSLAYPQSADLPPGNLESAQTQTAPDWGISANGDTRSLALLSESKTNVLSGGFSLTGTYDDNALSSTRHGVGNVGMLLSPTISVQQSRSRTFLIFNYFPGFTLNDRLSPRYDVYHDFNSSLQFRLTEHATLRVHDSFLYGTSSFNRFAQEGSSVSDLNILHQSNATTVTPLTSRLSNFGGADFMYRIAESTTVGVSANFNNLHFLNTSAATPLLDTQAQSADAVYQKVLSEHHAIGLTYTYRYLTTFGAASETTTTQSTLFFDSLSFSPNITLAVFAGPDRVSSGVLGTYRGQWHADGGLTFGWQGQRSSIRIGFIHHVTDGGGLTGAVSTYSLVSGARQKLGANWIASAEVIYGHNSPLETAFGPSFSSITGNVGLQKEFGHQVVVAAAYGRDYQSFVAPSFIGTSNHNREWISISYRFQRLLGH
jgi:hypothetical protein